jgi:hypothetical protein
VSSSGGRFRCECYDLEVRGFFDGFGVGAAGELATLSIQARTSLTL